MDISSLYSEKVMDHFKNPRNMGEIKDPSGMITVGNPTCGDIMRMFIKVGKRVGKNGKEEEFIEDAKFQTLGCGAAIASSSIATEMIIGKSLDEALSLSNQAVADALGGLPSIKMHCSVLAEEAISKAIDNYRSKK